MKNTERGVRGAVAVVGVLLLGLIGCVARVTLGPEFDAKPVSTAPTVADDTAVAAVAESSDATQAATVARVASEPATLPAEPNPASAPLVDENELVGPAFEKPAAYAMAARATEPP